MEPRIWDLTWAQGDTASSTVFVGADSLTGLDLPAAIDGTTLAVQAALTAGGTFKPLYDSTGAAVTVGVVAGARVALLPDAIRGQLYIRFVSDASQSAARAASLVGYR